MSDRRWLYLAVFQVATAINYLDRQVLAGVAPMVIEEFHLSKTEFGVLATAHALAYGLAAPFVGYLIDRLGLTRGISLATGVWSLAGIFTGLGSTLGSLAAGRFVLGLAQAGGIPASGKATRLFLKPEERAMGNATNQIAISVGLMAAPPLAVWLAMHWSWRSAFIVTGVLGLLWIPLWNRIAPPEAREPGGTRLTVVRDRRLWAFTAANALSMVLYSLWSNWPVLYLKEVFRIPAADAAWLAALPPLFSTAGAFAGGGLAWLWIRRGTPAGRARMRVCLLASVLALATAWIPWMPSPVAAALAMAASFFAVTMFSVNLYAMPMDAFDAGQAAFSIAMLTAAYGGMQAVVSPLIGKVIDLHGYAPVCIGAALTPLAAWALLRATRAA